MEPIVSINRSCFGDHFKYINERRRGFNDSPLAGWALWLQFALTSSGELKLQINKIVDELMDAPQLPGAKC